MGGWLCLSLYLSLLVRSAGCCDLFRAMISRRLFGIAFFFGLVVLSTAHFGWGAVDRPLTHLPPRVLLVTRIVEITFAGVESMAARV